MTAIFKYGVDLLSTSQESAPADANLLWKMLAAFTPQPKVIDETTTPPGSPSEGDVYIVTATATGDWTGQEGDFAIYLDSEWKFVTPDEGMTKYVADTNSHEVYDGSSWGAV